MSSFFSGTSASFSCTVGTMEPVLAMQHFNFLSILRCCFFIDTSSSSAPLLADTGGGWPCGSKPGLQPRK